MKSKVILSPNRASWLYAGGIFLILALPLLAIPPLFHPPAWGKTIVFRIILSILIFLFIYQLLLQKTRVQNLTIAEIWHRVKNRRNKVFWPFWLLAALLGIFFLATIFSLDPVFSFWGNPYRGGGFLNFASYIIFAILTSLIIPKKDWQKVWDFAIFIGILVSTIAIFQQFGLFSSILIPFSGRPPSTIGGPTFLAVYLLLLTFLTLSFGLREKILKKKIFHFFALLLFIYVILITGSRAAYFGLLIGFSYFLFSYSKSSLSSKKKVLLLSSKILTGIVLLTVVYSIYYINYINKEPELPSYLKESKVVRTILPRLSISLALQEPRFSAWLISLEAIKRKPILGYGPENFSIGFDKYYDPLLPLITKDWGSWWDRAHNFLFDISVAAGIPALMIYLSFFAALFWNLQKIKERQPENSLICHGIQASFLGYLAANFFSFETFSIYLISFFLIGYSLHLISTSGKRIEENKKPARTVLDGLYLHKKIIISILFICLIWFIWAFNLKPLQINKELNVAIDLAEAKKCQQALDKNEQILTAGSTFLDAYARVKYFDNLRKCEEEMPEMKLKIAKRGSELLKESTKLWPYHTRSWIYLGQFTNVVAEQDPSLSSKDKNELIKKSHEYFKRAQQLSPKHQEIYIEWSKTYILSKDYQGAKQKAQECINLNPKTGDCWWMKGVAEAFLGEKEKSQKDIAVAVRRRHDPNTYVSLSQLANAYFASKNYPELAKTYEKLIKLRPNEYKFHASLAFVYKELGEYEKAEEEALKVLELNPEAKKEVNEFLQTLH